MSFVAANLNRVTPPQISKNEYEDLQEEVLLLRAVIENFPGGLSLIDKNLKLVFCNDQQKKLLDYPPNLFEYGNPSLEQLFRFNATRGEYGPGDIEKHVADRMTLVMQRRAHVFERTRPNGTALEIRGVPLEGGGFMTTYLDVTGRRQALPESAENAEYDKLTGLPKGVLLRARISQMIANCKPSHVAAIHCMDLDHFEDINTNYGQATGDALLQAVAGRLQEVVRGNDTVARIGGDRFAVLQSEVKRPSDVAKLANRILDSIRKPIVIGEQSICLSSSIGLALMPRDGTDPDSLMAKAEAAVLLTKTRSRGGFEAETANWD
ncbi:MAG: diguanylate cyclase [Aestuariivirga sp.]